MYTAWIALDFSSMDKDESLEMARMRSSRVASPALLGEVGDVGVLVAAEAVPGEAPLCVRGPLRPDMLLRLPFVFLLEPNQACTTLRGAAPELGKEHPKQKASQQRRWEGQHQQQQQLAAWEETHDTRHSLSLVVCAFVLLLLLLVQTLLVQTKCLKRKVQKL